MTTRAYDNNGNEIFMTTVIIVSPIKYIDEAVNMASNYMKDVEEVIDWQPERMLPICLSSNGEQPTTHRICSREIYDNQIPIMIAAMHNYDWCAKREYTLNDDIMQHFCIIRCSIEQFLEKTGLKQIA